MGKSLKVLTFDETLAAGRYDLLRVAMQDRLHHNLTARTSSPAWKTLKEAGFDWQRDRSWCESGVVERKRGGEVVTVVDPDAEAKKS